MQHVRYLAETIGPRGSTTPKEAEAASYVSEVLRKLGLEPVIETFTSATSMYYPTLLLYGIVLVGELLFLFGGRWGATAALALALPAFVSSILAMAFRPNPLSWLLPKGKSQNVWALLSPREEARHKVVLVGHLDTHRTPLLFSSDKWTTLLKVVVPMGSISVVLLLIFFAVGIAETGWLLRVLSLPCALINLGIFLLFIQAALTPYTAGANDNASGVGVILNMAEQLKDQLLARTAVWVVFTGCEEVGCYGADAFAKTHREELENAAWIAVDQVGGTGANPSYLTSERFLLTTHSDPGLLTLAESVAAHHPELDARPSSYTGAFTEGCIGAKYGFRLLTLLAFTEKGKLPEWHRPTDIVKNVDPEVVEHSETFVRELLHKIDQQAC